jgi:hypothetical protein
MLMMSGPLGGWWDNLFKPGPPAPPPKPVDPVAQLRSEVKGLELQAYVIPCPQLVVSWQQLDTRQKELAKRRSDAKGIAADLQKTRNLIRLRCRI